MIRIAAPTPMTSPVLHSRAALQRMVPAPGPDGGWRLGMTVGRSRHRRRRRPADLAANLPKNSSASSWPCPSISRAPTWAILPPTWASTS